MTLPAYLQTYLRNALICPPHLWPLLDDMQTAFEDLRLDALVPVEMAMLIEEHTGRDIADEVYERWHTLGDVAGVAGEVIA